MRLHASQLLALCNCMVLPPHRDTRAAVRRHGRCFRMSADEDASSARPQWLEVRWLCPCMHHTRLLPTAVAVQTLLFGRAGRPRPREPPEEEVDPDPVSRYIPPELSPSSQANSTQAAVRWERRVQWDAMREGSEARQNEILRKELGKQ